MKPYILIMTFLVSISVFAQVKTSPITFICAKQVIKYYEDDLRGSNHTDKFMHCSMSCLLAAKCGSETSLMAGVLKEVKDLFGPGNAELADLKADLRGIQMGTGLIFSYKNTNEKKQICENKCVKYYP